MTISDQDADDAITRHHGSSLASYLSHTEWQLALVLTVSNRPNSDVPRFSPATLVSSAYPRFRAILAEHVGQPLSDFWVVERGTQFGRQHIHALLASDTPIPHDLVRGAWHAVAKSSSWVEPFDPTRHIGYTIKEVISAPANVFEYGGSVVYGNEPPAQTRPRRTRKSDHARHKRPYRNAARIPR